MSCADARALARKVIRFQYRAGGSPGGGGSDCDPNYSGCLDPNAYDLDRDGDGIACDV